MTVSILKDNPEIVEKLIDIVSKEGFVDREQVSLDTELADLGIESADYVMILMAIEETFDTYISVDSELTDAKTVADLLVTVVTKIKDKQQADEPVA